jgi:anti-anti-sigma factor
MTMNTIWLTVNESNVGPVLQEVREKFRTSDNEVVLDFEPMRRIDSCALRAMERLATAAEDKSIRVVIHGVNVNVYKVLKLTKLAARFSFTTSGWHCSATERESLDAERTSK